MIGKAHMYKYTDLQRHKQDVLKITRWGNRGEEGVFKIAQKSQCTKAFDRFGSNFLRDLNQFALNNCVEKAHS